MHIMSKLSYFVKGDFAFQSPNRATSIVAGQNWSFSSGHVKEREREREIPIKGVSPCPM